MKKAFGAVLALWIAVSQFGLCAFCAGISAASYVCMAAGTGDILDSRDMLVHRGMASTTKIMTALLAIESGRLDETVEIRSDLIAAEGTSMGLKTGDRLSLYELVKGMMLSSGNDAANAVALFLEGSFTAFAAKMNRRAAQLGMNDTHFVTPSGLDDDAHYSCAYDMALLADAALRDPVFAQISAMNGAYVHFADGRRLYIAGHNKMFSQVEGCIGVKTGYTKKSGRCLVSAVRRDGVTVIVVTLGAPDDWSDHAALYEEAFGKLVLCTYLLPEAAAVAVVGGTSDAVPCSVRALPALAAFGPQELRVEYCISPFVYAPVKAGDPVGYALIFADGYVAAEASVVADASVQAQTKGKKSWKDVLARLFNSVFNYG